MTKKNNLKNKFQFSTSVVRPPLLNTSLKKLFGETHLKKQCLWIVNFVFKIISVYPQWWIIQKLSTFFWWEQISIKINFPQNMTSVFYHRFSVTSSITMSFKEICNEKKFHENYFFWKVIFCNCYHQSCVFHWYIILNPSNCFVKMIIYEKNTR